MAIPEKYSHIDFTPPSGVRREAEYGLKLRREYGRGGTAVGIARARDLSNGKELSPSTLRRMKAYFDRHQSDQQGDGFNRGDKGWPSNGYIAAKLWGGFQSGYSWAKKVVEQMNAADEESRSLRPKGSTFGIEPRVVVVHGPPGSGKADYVREHKGENDVVFEFDSIMRALSGGPKNDNLISYCLDIRNLILEKSLRKPKVDCTWVIATRVDDDFRRALGDVPVRYVEMEASKDECLRRVSEDPSRQDVLDETKDVIERYFSERSSPVASNVERRYLGAFSSVERADPQLLGVERRADPETGKTRTYIVGYAAKFQTDSLLLGDFVERIAPSAFEIVEKREDFDGKPLETRCLFNHSPDHLLGRFPNTLRMWVDEVGLRYECLLPESRQDLAELIERGDLRGSSFSFVVADGGERWSTENGQSIRTVTRIKSLLDVSPVTYPAYGDATVAVAKRSYEHFIAEKKQKVETRSFVKDKAASIRAETEKFLAERRAFCPTGDGGGVDNSCGAGGGSGQGSDEKAVLQKKAVTSSGSATTGAVLGATVGLVGGLPGVLVGTATGAILGAIIDAFKTSKQKAKSESLRKSIGVSDKQLQGVADSLMGGEKVDVSVADENTLMLSSESSDWYAWLSPSSQFGSKEPGASLHVVPPGADVDVPSMEKAANVMGAKFVSVEAWSDGDAKMLESKGYKRIDESPGGFSISKGIYEKKLGKSKRSAEVAKEIRTFLSERRSGDCGRDDSGRFGSGNECQQDGGKYMEMPKGDKSKAQKFIDDAREGQLRRGGKDGGKSDDGGGVQTWSKGDDFPWTPKRVGTDEGYIQGTHPDGSTTEKYPFKGGNTDEAFRLMREEIKKFGRKRSSEVVIETLRFLRERAR